MTTRARVVIALFAISIFGALITGRDLFYNLVYLWGALLVSSYLWARVSLLGVKLERQPRSTRAQVGQLFVERFDLVNESRISKVWVEARDESDLPGYKVTAMTAGLGSRGFLDHSGHRASTVTVDLGSHHRRTWIQRTLCTQRGRYQLGPLLLYSGDLFGLFPVEKQVPALQHLVVLPMTVPIRNFPVPSGRLSGGEAIRQRTHQVTPNAATVRDYTTGDSLNRIHWPSTVKRRRLIVKEFELDPLGDVWILLDAHRKSRYVLSPKSSEGQPSRRSIDGYQLPPSSEEYAVTIAASLGLYFLEIDRAVGLISYAKTRHVIQPDRGESQRFRILESLAVLNAVGKHDLQEVIRVESPRIPRGSTVIIISAAVGSVVMTAIRELAYGVRHPILILLDADSFGGPPGTGSLTSAARREGVPVKVVRCGERLETVLNVSSRVRTRYSVVQSENK